MAYVELYYVPFSSPSFHCTVLRGTYHTLPSFKNTMLSSFDICRPMEARSKVHGLKRLKVQASRMLLPMPHMRLFCRFTFTDFFFLFLKTSTLGLGLPCSTRAKARSRRW